MTLNWSSHFKRTFKKIISSTPEKKQKLVHTLNDLSENAFATHLRTHKLKGDLKNCWACYVEYDIRIVFTFVSNEETKEQEILLLNIGSHDEVY